MSVAETERDCTLESKNQTDRYNIIMYADAFNVSRGFPHEALAAALSIGVHVT